ncbi:MULTISPECIES: hypothetical protein [unclassified Mycobacterium]|uniref:hypothetical protein n=1 Tax=unclassified Mycobacterium TaxID=2642494 RepID=UPI00073FEAEB|nr:MULTISPECIES: hypothetical protein [unclassified Mycobacterium]KUH88349.1 hypothetical protein AU186_03990 [Mycobacterium sp. GA-1999]KUH90931.1 hypothetical protein AU185_04440 [Mycobacterium sp. GA-0227b]KUH91220.1 hypothetical protein AU187_16815 [Mycobacterium sp. IS-1556]
MRLVADSGLWTTGPLTTPSPLLAVLEVSGAVLSWTVDDVTESQITFTDVARADWLWRVVGESGHSAVASMLTGRSAVDSVEVVDVNLLPGALEPLRRLALGHWLRRWWPASQRDAIPVLDSAILDAEVALLTAAAQDYFGDDTFDSELTHLLAPHAAALNAAVLEGDPRIGALVERCRNVADDIGVALDAEPVTKRRDDYALAAGAEAGGRGAGVIAGGTASINWGAVPPGIFDAAEGAVDWTVELDGDVVNGMIGAELTGLGSPHGIAVRLQSGTVGGAGALGADGRAAVPLVDPQRRPITEPAAWNHDWRDTTVIVGVDVAESVQTRERVRAFARFRLRQPVADAFLAEILAAESDY